MLEFKQVRSFFMDFNFYTVLKKIFSFSFRVTEIYLIFSFLWYFLPAIVDIFHFKIIEIEPLFYILLYFIFIAVLIFLFEKILKKLQ